MATSKETELTAITQWQEATDAVRGIAERAKTGTVSREMFEDIKDLRANEREAWKRCREFMSEL
jgi:hypothetical protein